MLSKANEVFGWSVAVRDVCSVWSEGCIIRGAILGTFFDAMSGDEHLGISDIAKIRQALLDNHQATRATICFGVEQAIPTPALNGAISWFDAFASARMPQAITQAQRDAFGSHGIKLFENPGKNVHGEW